MEKADIILIPFPFSDLRSQKLRPALIIHSKANECIVLAITSQKKWKDSFVIENNKLAEGMLPLKSYVRITKVASLKKTLIQKKVAKLNEVSFQNIVRNFTKQF